MGRKQQPRIRLGERDLAILRYLAEQHTTWFEAIHGRFYAGRSVEATRSTMRRLCGKAPNFRFVRSDQIDGSRSFFRLTPRGAKVVGAPQSVTKELGRTALLRRYSLQWFLELDAKHARWTCHPRDYPDLFPIQGQRLPRGNFYFEETERGNMLGFAVEDYGADPRRIARRAVDTVERFLKQHWFDDLMVAGRFGLTFLVATESKAKAIELQFHRESIRRLKPWFQKLTSNGNDCIVQSYRVVPGLLSLIPHHTPAPENEQHGS